MQSLDPNTDPVARRALIAAAALSDGLREDVAKAIAALGPRAEPEAILAAAERVLGGYAGPLAQLMADATLAAWLRGAGDTARLLPAAPPPGGAPPPRPPFADGEGDRWDWDGSRAWLPLIDAAVADLRDRRLLLKADWEQLSSDLRQRAFTAAGLTTQDALATVRNALVEAVDAGTGFSRFVDTVDESLGQSPLGLGRLGNVFRTNTGQAYANAAHRLGEMPAVRDRFPYRERLIVDDSRITDLCYRLARAGLQGTAIYRSDDPVWRHFRPLSHWQCRCGVRLLSIKEAAARGIETARRWLETGVDPRDFVPWPQGLRLPKGWTSEPL